jgi:hypothetical protein
LWRGVVWPGAVRQARQVLFRRGVARHGVAGKVSSGTGGEVRQGMARPGMAGEVRRAWVGCGMVRFVLAWQAWLGGARFG